MTHAADSPPTSEALVAGKYELVRLIGRGGMGSVWEGRHKSLGTRVAIKFIDGEYLANDDARARFEREAHAAAKLRTKHAIQVSDHGITGDGKPYIVMELLEGEPLDKRLDRLGKMPLEDVARILQQVSRALGRAHEAGIIHRDLKPENIFLVRGDDDDEEIAKVLDFGIAKIRSHDGQTLSESTKTGALLGTPYYMSPEQARGLREIDHRTDLWSLGVIAFRCATGVLPFEGHAVGDLLVKICTAPIPRPSLVNAELPATFDAWFARALDRDPGARFQSAGEMADELAAACGLRRRSSGEGGIVSSASGGRASYPSHPSTPSNPSPMVAAASSRASGNRGSSFGEARTIPSGPPPPVLGTQASGVDGGHLTAAPFVASVYPAKKGGKFFALGIAAIAVVSGLGVAARGLLRTPAVVAPVTAAAASTAAPSGGTSAAAGSNAAIVPPGDVEASLPLSSLPIAAPARTAPGGTGALKPHGKGAGGGSSVGATSGKSSPAASANMPVTAHTAPTSPVAVEKPKPPGGAATVTSPGPTLGPGF